MHAGGAPPTPAGTDFYVDALSAFEFHYNKGARLFEVDLLYTADTKTTGDFVCVHQQIEFEHLPLYRFPEHDESSSYDPDKMPSIAEYNDMIGNTYNLRFDHCTSTSLFDWLNNHMDAELLLDLKMDDQVKGWRLVH
jgi:hypothetical protein